jgi:hypothetical protein
MGCMTIIERLGMCDAIFVQEDPFHDDPDVEESSAIRDMRRPLLPIPMTERWKRISCCPPAGQMMLRFRVVFMLCAFRRVGIFVGIEIFYYFASVSFSRSRSNGNLPKRLEHFRLVSI